MLINSTHRILILNPLKAFFTFLFFCCFVHAPAVLPAQAFSADALPDFKISGAGKVSQIDSFCGKTFFKRLFIQGQSTAGYNIVPAPNGNFFLATSVNEKTMVILVDKNMEMIWTQSMDLGAGNDAITDMRLDSEGQIIGVGNAGAAPVACFAFKMNAANGQLIWRSQLNSPINSYFTRILEKNNGSGNYFLFGQTDAVGGTGCNTLLMEINRNTGQLIWDRHYTLGSCEAIYDVYIENNQIYTCGRYNLNGAGQAGFRAALTVLDMDGNVQWSRHYLRSMGQIARLHANELLPDNGGIVLFGWGNDAGTNLTATAFQLMKTDSAGALEWAKKYEVAGGNEERAFRLINLPDGYLMCGTFVRPNVAGKEIGLIKTNKNGDFLWGKSYGMNGEDRLNDVLLVADTLYLIGSTQKDDIFDILVGKLDLDGNVDTQCPVVKPLELAVSEYPNPLDDYHTLIELNVTHNYSTAALPVQVEENVTTEAICQKICVAGCDKPDAGVTIDSVYCDGGSTVVKLRIHNTGLAQFPANSMLSFYDADPKTTPANLLRTMQIPFAVDAGTSLSVEIFDGHTFLPANSSLVLYAVVNDDGSLVTPFFPDSLANTGIEECDYANNTDSRSFTTPGSPLLDLGPDLLICPGVEFLIPAGADFFQYHWQDGSDAPYIVALNPGNYWVEVTDVCGYRQTDSILIKHLPYNERAENIEFCLGDSVLIGGGYYTQPGTVMDTIVVTGSGCDTIVTYHLSFPPGSSLDLLCPADTTVVAAPGSNTVQVNYNIPTVSTDCSCSDAALILKQGPATGGHFPAGATQVCYEASDDCGNSLSCCFTVTVQNTPPDIACDVKTTPCVKFEILGIFQNPAKQKTYRMRVTNACANKLIYATFQLPPGLTADKPLTNTTYTAPGGRQYEVRNPNASPAHSIRFKTIGNGIANGQSDIFEYTLPQQADPLYIHATVRLDPQIYVETHLNVFNCEVQQVPNRPSGSDDRQAAEGITPERLIVSPNPASDVLFVQMPAWENQRIQLCITDIFGRQIYLQTATAEAGRLMLDLPADWPAGLYYIETSDEQGKRQTGRFVRAAQR